MSTKAQNDFVIEDGKRLIVLSLLEKLDNENIEISYRIEDEQDWAYCFCEYFSMSDIKGMAKCIRSVMFQKHPAAEYSSRNNLFQLGVEYDSDSELFTFTASVIDVIEVTIIKRGLTKNGLEDIVQPFFEWEKQYARIK